MQKGDSLRKADKEIAGIFGRHCALRKIPAIVEATPGTGAAPIFPANPGPSANGTTYLTITTFMLHGSRLRVSGKFCDPMLVVVGAAQVPFADWS